MNTQLERWALIAMLISGFVLFVGEMLNGNAVRSIIWLAALALVGSMLLRDRRARARTP